MANMKGLDGVVKRIETELDEKEKVREFSIKSARFIARQSGSAIKRMQSGANPAQLLAKAKRETLKLRSTIDEHPELAYTGYVENAFQELSEAFIVHAIKGRKPIPRPESIGVTNTAYLLGMGDSVGEFRRFALLALTKGNVKSASKYLNIMEELYQALMRFDYPHAIVAIRRKQDIARSLIEKTRGDILVSSRSKELEKKLDRLQRKLR
jgi:translin